MRWYFVDQRHAADHTRVSVFYPWADLIQTCGPEGGEGFRRSPELAGTLGLRVADLCAQCGVAR